MGQACDATYYDRVYQTSDSYALSHTKAPWAPLWEFVAENIEPDDRVLDLGCGPGHLAALLVDAGTRPAHYVGVDFSAVALKQAAARVPEAAFVRGQIPGCIPQLFVRHEASVVTFCEVLEHLGRDDDVTSIRLLPLGLRIIGTVPNFDDPAHVRVFEKPAAVVARYGKLVAIDRLVWINKTHMGFVGWRR